MSNIYYFTLSNYGSRKTSLEIFEGGFWDGILNIGTDRVQYVKVYDIR